MLYHGIAKVRGEGARQHAPFFESVGIRPGERWARLTGVAETFAGAATILGIATRPAALAVIATQAVAIWKVHAPKGYANAQGGMEYNLSLLALAAGLLVEGPRKLSAHAALRRPRSAWTRFLPVARAGAMDRALDVIH